MIKILIIDDDSDKIQNIIRSIKVHPAICNDNIEYALDAVNGRKKLNEKVYDLLILDMNLPTSLGDDPVRDGGLVLLKQIHTKQIANLSTHKWKGNENETCIWKIGNDRCASCIIWRLVKFGKCRQCENLAVEYR